MLLDLISGKRYPVPIASHWIQLVPIHNKFFSAKFWPKFGWMERKK
jgi:hypothetical protein